LKAEAEEERKALKAKLWCACLTGRYESDI
jgi:hypothetical protein